MTYHPPQAKRVASVMPLGVDSALMQSGRDVQRLTTCQVCECCGPTWPSKTRRNASDVLFEFLDFLDQVICLPPSFDTQVACQLDAQGNELTHSIEDETAFSGIMNIGFNE